MLRLFLIQKGVKYVNWIFDTFLENNYSLQSMETVFKKQGIKTINGAFFSTTQLHKILTTSYYVEATPDVYDFYAEKGCQIDPDSPREKWDGTHGVMVYGKTTERAGRHTLQAPDKWLVCLGYHRPFISAEKWLATQERFSNNTFNKSMKYDIPLLKGAVRCAKCRCLMQVSRKKKKVGVSSYYYCLKRSRQGIEACDMRHINRTVLDEKLLVNLDYLFKKFLYVGIARIFGLSRHFRYGENFSYTLKTF